MADIKQQLISYVYNRLPIKKFRYNIVKTQTDIDYLKNNPHYVGFNFYGFSNFLVFLELEGSYYSFFIDRKTLSYDEKHVNNRRVMINQVRLKVDKKLYRCTIFDGIYNCQNKKQIFIITDAYFIEGKSCMDVEYREKMKNIREQILPKIIVNEDTDKINFYIDNTYTYSDLKRIVDVDNNKFKPGIHLNARGLIFYPTKSDNKYIFNTASKKQSSELAEVSDDDTLQVESPPTVKKETKIVDPVETKAIMLMKQANTNGVYDMYLRQTKKKHVKVGLACINTETTKLCKKLFQKNEDGETPKEVVVACIWKQNFKKWMPLKKSTSEVDFYDDIYVADSDSES